MALIIGWLAVGVVVALSWLAAGSAVVRYTAPSARDGLLLAWWLFGALVVALWWLSVGIVVASIIYIPGIK